MSVLIYQPSINVNASYSISQEKIKLMCDV